jgi:hypothetical protein
MEYHPQKTQRVLSGLDKEYKKIWDDLRKGSLLESWDEFVAVLKEFKDVIVPIRNEVGFRATIVQAQLKSQFPHDYEHRFMKTAIANEFCFRASCPYQVVGNFLIEQIGVSYDTLISDLRFRHLVNVEEEDIDMSGEQMSTHRILRHALKTYTMCGNKTYVVSPGLSLQMRHIGLKNMPEEFLQAPYPTLYLTLPTDDPFMIYNKETGWHAAEGMYIVADEATTPRCWRMILAAGPNVNSISKDDDALFHYYIVLQKGKTLEECIEFTIENDVKPFAISRKINNTVILNPAFEGDQKQIFEQSKDCLIAAFRYAVNIMLYVTHPDCEQEVFNSSPEFQALYKRTHKAKGKKRKALFTRMRDCQGEDLILLGKSVVISREERTALTEPRRKGSKHRVRTYVAAHWQHYWKGPLDSERERVYTLKQAYWKGEENLPMTTAQRHVQ